MDKLTALRTFGNPGLTPARGFRIYHNRWYLCRFQNIERGMDYIGLGEGEYTSILPGDAARRERDAQLNNLNAISEWTGPVYAVIDHTRCNLATYVGSEEDANRLVEEAIDNVRDWDGDANLWVVDTMELLWEWARETDSWKASEL